MTKKNPVVDHLRSMYSNNDLLLLDAMNGAYTILLDAAIELRELGDHEKAELLESFGESLLQATDDIAEQIDEGEDSIFGSDAEASLEEELAIAYWRRYGKKYGSRIETDKELADIVRHIVHSYPNLVPSEQISDNDAITAARDAYKQSITRRS